VAAVIITYSPKQDCTSLSPIVVDTVYLTCPSTLSIPKNPPNTKSAHDGTDRTSSQRGFNTIDGTDRTSSQRGFNTIDGTDRTSSQRGFNTIDGTSNGFGRPNFSFSSPFSR
jgi:hypothetical protein